MERPIFHLSLGSFIPFAPLAVGLALTACGANADTNPDAASGSALAGASASAQDYKSGASANPGVVDVGTAQLALTALTGNVDLSVQSFQALIAARAGHSLAAGGGQGVGGGATQSASLTCAGGGGASVDGYMDMARGPAAFDINLAIAFSGCATRSGTLLDGHVEFSQGPASATNAATPFQVETTYVGDVNVSGNVNLSCPVDLNVLVDETGRALDVQGTFCNQDASALSMQLQPLWQRQ